MKNPEEINQAQEKGDKKMDNEQKEKIERAILELRYAWVRHYQAILCRSRRDEKIMLINALKAQNNLYDAIGGMKEYKFDVK